ncbi:MAG: hypothetical protein ACLFTH_03950 [Candidatus Woesearchaeota archaeon]
MKRFLRRSPNIESIVNSQSRTGLQPKHYMPKLSRKHQRVLEEHHLHHVKGWSSLHFQELLDRSRVVYIVEQIYDDAGFTKPFEHLIITPDKEFEENRLKTFLEKHHCKYQSSITPDQYVFGTGRTEIFALGDLEPLYGFKSVYQIRDLKKYSRLKNDLGRDFIRPVFQESDKNYLISTTYLRFGLPPFEYFMEKHEET